MIWRIIVVTSFVLSNTMMSLCKDVTFEQSFHRHDDVENDVPAAKLKLSAGETGGTKHSRVVGIVRSFAKLSIDNSRINATFDCIYSETVKRRDLIIFNFPQSFPQVRMLLSGQFGPLIIRPCAFGPMRNRGMRMRLACLVTRIHALKYL